MFPPVDVVELRVAPVELAAYARPDRRALVGVVAAGEAFAVYEHVPGPPRCRDWGRVDLGAHVCLDLTKVTTETPVSLPRLGFDDLLRAYARRGRGAAGPIFADVAAYEAGADPLDWFEADHSYAFVARVTTSRGEVLVRQGGEVVPVNEVVLYEPSAFAGEAVTEAGPWSWCAERDGCLTTGGVALPFQAAFIASEVALEPGARVRMWVPAERPRSVADDEVWVDIDLAQQTIGLMRGDASLYVSLVSAGVGGEFRTPRGVFRVQDKIVENDMISLDDAPERYHVEAVPWVVHFRPRFALHGAYWHARFGWPMSHGCVNLSPIDARRIFDAVGPELPPGWRAVYAREGVRGSVIRIR